MRVFTCLRPSAVWWGKWMMDDRQKSYVIAPSALMVLGRCTPLPDPDLLLRMTQRFCTLTFALYIPIFSSSLTIGTAGSIPPYPHWLCVLLNIAFCSRPAHCTEICIIYRWGTDSLLSGVFIWEGGLKYSIHKQKWGSTGVVSVGKWNYHIYTVIWDVDSYSWSLL